MELLVTIFASSMFSDAFIVKLSLAIWQIGNLQKKLRIRWLIISKNEDYFQCPMVLRAKTENEINRPAEDVARGCRKTHSQLDML